MQCDLNYFNKFVLVAHFHFVTFLKITLNTFCVVCASCCFYEMFNKSFVFSLCPCHQGNKEVVKKWQAQVQQKFQKLN